jgi:HEAT repeat protein
MALFAHRQRVPQLAAAGDIVGLREVLVGAAGQGAGDAETLAAAASALVDLGEGGIAALVDAILDDPDRVHFSWIADETFHRAAGPHAVAVLSETLLHAPDPDRRLTACALLRRLNTPLAEEAFVEAVADSNPHVRLSAARGLAEHGDARGVRALLEWVAHADNPSPALDGLVKLGDAGVVPVLEQLRSSGRSGFVVAEIDRAIRQIRADQARRREPGPVARLEAVRDRLRSIEVVDRATRVDACPPPREARQQIPVICDNIDHAVTTLRCGKAPDGRPISPAQVGRGLAALVADASGPGFADLLAAVLYPRGVRAVQDQIVELDRIAADLQERPVFLDRAEG